MITLINVLLIFAGPFAVVGALTAVASASWPGMLLGLVRPPMQPPARPVTRPRPRVRWAVA